MNVNLLSKTTVLVLLHKSLIHKRRTLTDSTFLHTRDSKQKCKNEDVSRMGDIETSTYILDIVPLSQRGSELLIVLYELVVFID